MRPDRTEAVDSSDNSDSNKRVTATTSSLKKAINHVRNLTSLLAAASTVFILALFGTSASAEKDAAKDKPVLLFVLAGQSNMEGKATNFLYNHQATDAKTKDQFTRFRKDGKWVVRDDVFIKFLKRKGGLTLGYGSPKRTGVELAFGTTLGNKFDQPIILVKAAWGGHSLFKLFRSPSAGMPSVEKLQAELDQARKRVENRNKKRKRKQPVPTMDDIKQAYGLSYRNMLAEVKETLKNYETMFPKLKGRKVKIAGFVWHQGWNDQYGAQDEYASNMKHFINDVRKDLGVPKLPFVIGVMGQNGSKPAKGAMATIQKAQLSMEKLPEFRGNVKAVRTDVLVDKVAEKLYPTWRKNFEQWKLTGSDFGYHYMGSAIWHNRIGDAMAAAMLELMKK